MKNIIIKVWIWISEFGISPDHIEENELIRSYNRMSVLSIIGVLSAVILAILTDFSKIYIFSASLTLFIYTAALIANYYKRIFLARYFVSVGSPLWYNGFYLFMGGFFCQGLANLASMAITYVAFQKMRKSRNGLLILHVCLFAFSIIYVNIYGPIYKLIDFPNDEFMVFAGGLGWTIIVLFTFDKDRSKLLKSLKLNNQELKDTTEELERFTYIASHDLKSPLRTIISFIGLIERDLQKGNYENIKENLGFVKSGAEQMNFLVQDILELSVVNKFNESKRAVVDLNKVFEKASLNLSIEIEEKNAIIHCDPLPNFECNELEFLLLFQNFIQNAIKYNESDQPHVWISSQIIEEELQLSIKDNGIGIEPEYHEQIFQFFKRLHTSEIYQGTGLGLGLCKKIINSYNGAVEIDSALGSGACFTLIFPIEKKKEVQPEVEKALMVV